MHMPPSFPSSYLTQTICVVGLKADHCIRLPSKRKITKLEFGSRQAHEMKVILTTATILLKYHVYRYCMLLLPLLYFWKEVCSSKRQTSVCVKRFFMLSANCMAIVNGKDEALLCEANCQLWYHCGCVSVPSARTGSYLPVRNHLLANHVPFWTKDARLLNSIQR